MDEEVSRLVESIEDPMQREDSRELIEIMNEVTGEPPQLSASNMLGFGTCHFRYDSGRSGDTYKIGFAPRSDSITIYLISGMVGYDDLLSRLGKHRRAKSAIYIRRLADINVPVLVELLDRAVRHIDQVIADRGALPRMSKMPPYRPD